ncbi:MAG TPA: cardiolipin synthase [Phycisphaerales bacterium]|nr:cardiolipin synthase [Phycisphaerales bacterium]
MWWLLIAVVWLYGLYLAWRVVHEGRTSQGSLCWIITLILVPPIAIPLFWLMGDRRLEGYIRARRSGFRKLDVQLRAMHNALGRSKVEPDDEGLRVLAKLAKLPWTKGNTAKHFDNADEMYDALIESIDGSLTTIQMQFYIYRDDDIGHRVRDALIRARARGVSVWLMYDEIGCAGTPKAYFESLKQAGVNVSGFRTVPSRRRLLRLNFRNHRKLVVIDGSTVFFGGMNVGCEYCGRDEAIGLWRDTHAKATGPVALAGQMIFLEDWYWAQRTVPKEFVWEVSKHAQADDERRVDAMLLYPSGPIDDRESGLKLFLQLIAEADKRLWIATPYFVCDEAVMHAIELAKLRGVDVRILVPATPDSFLVKHAASSFISEAIANGIAVYHYTRGFTHQKVIFCDDLVSIGSANVDHRSMILNFELTGLVSDGKFAASVARMLETDMRRAARLPDAWWKELGAWHRFQARLARLIGPML